MRWYSQSIAVELAASKSTSTLIDQLYSTAPTRKPPAYLPPNKCHPGGDVAVGYAISRLALTKPLLAIDTTYANRVLPWTGWQASVEVSRRAAIVHNATEWSTHKWALCLSTDAIKEEGRDPKKGARQEVAPVFKCRGREAPTVKCGRMRCGPGPIAPLHNNSECARDGDCASYYTSAFSNWTFCIAVGQRRVQRTTLRAERRSVCKAEAEEVIGRCQRGFRT